MADIDGDSHINYYGRDKNPLSYKLSLTMFGSIEFVKVFASPDRKDVPDNHHRTLDDDANNMIEDGSHSWYTPLMYSYTVLVFLIICIGPWRK